MKANDDDRTNIWIESDWLLRMNECVGRLKEVVL